MTNRACVATLLVILLLFVCTSVDIEWTFKDKSLPFSEFFSRGNDLEKDFCPNLSSVCPRKGGVYRQKKPHKSLICKVFCLFCIFCKNFLAEEGGPRYFARNLRECQRFTKATVSSGYGLVTRKWLLSRRLSTFRVDIATSRG